MTNCTTAGAMTAGNYCAFASSAGSAYCIFTKLENVNQIVAASERGVRIIDTPATINGANVCP